MASGEETTKWQDGLWKNPNSNVFVVIVDGNKAEYKTMLFLDHPDLCKTMFEGTWKFGDFGAAHADVAEATGVQNYNLEMDLVVMKQYGVLNEDGTKITFWDFTQEIGVMMPWSEADMEKFKARDH